jgi:polysaccharide export outer membrane protein
MRSSVKTAFLASVLLLVISASAQNAALHPVDAGPSTSASTAKEPAATSIAKSDFVIGADDVLAVHVWKEPELSSQQVPVRPDGRISLALVGDVQASGLTVHQLQDVLSKRLQDYVASPVVTVVVKEMHSRSFNILGEVVRPGAYPLDKPTSVVDAIALAGGFREWAKVKSIYVLRRDTGGARRLSFNYKSAIRGNQGDFELQPKDTIVVP